MSGEQEGNAEKASKPIPVLPPDEERGALAMRLDIFINERGDVATSIGVGSQMAYAYFLKRYPLAATMLNSLTRGPQEPPPLPLVGTPPATEPDG